MQELQKKYGGEGEVLCIAINSTSDGHGDYRNAEQLKEDAADKGTAAEYIVLDPEGEIGKMYGAKTTPHIFIIDPEGKLIYMGAADSIKSTEAEDIPKATNYIDLSLTEGRFPSPRLSLTGAALSMSRELFHEWPYLFRGSFCNFEKALMTTRI